MTTPSRCDASRSVSRRLWACGLLGLGLLVGCASTQVSNRQVYQGGKLPRPGRIIVYDFAATPGDLPAWSDAGRSFSDAGATMDESDLEEARKLGADVAKRLVSKIEGMGMNAVRAEGQPGPRLDDIVLVGYFTSVDKGSATERVLIGFGKGAASVGVRAEGYHMTADGLELLGAGDVASGGSKGPGLVVPALVTVATANPIGLAVGGAVKAAGEVSGRSTDKGSAERIANEIAQVLQERFQQQGWI